MAVKKKKTSKKGKKKQNINRKLNEILDVEKKLLKKESDIEREEKNVEKEEKILENRERKTEFEEKKEESELEKLERMEHEIKKEVGEHPLSKISIQDIVKGFVGAFIGLAIHYTFVYGVEISENLTVTRATLLFPFTFVVGLLFIYATGFRKIKDPKLLIFMPLRLIVLYACAIVMSIVVLFLFYPTFGHSLVESYKMLAGVLLAAVVGACTADLLGKE